MGRKTTAILAASLVACHAAATGDDTDAGVAVDYTLAGPHVVGTVAFTASDDARSRTLNAQVWYPADPSARAAADAGFPVEEFGFGDEVATLTGLLGTALEPGTLRTAHAAVDAAPADGPWPVVLFSHCLDCTRFSTFEIAERLASHGFAVLAADHAGGALYNRLQGDSATFGSEFLDVRAADVSFLLDQALDNAPSVPQVLHDRFDADRVGMYGHSFGAVTTGRVLMLDDRIKSGLGFGAPMENPLSPGVTLSELHVPLMFVVATEDNSISEAGNFAIRGNFASANPPVYKLEVADAGHYGFTTICGIIPDFGAGCASGDERQTDGTAFDYLDVGRVRGIAANYAAAFFAATLLDDAGARAWITAPPTDSAVTVDVRAE